MNRPLTDFGTDTEGYRPKPIKCRHCGKEFKTSQEYMDDCFVSSDGWSWDYFHNCLNDKGIEIHGYEK
jgi:hypothetical protein